MQNQRQRNLEQARTLFTNEVVPGFQQFKRNIQGQYRVLVETSKSGPSEFVASATIELPQGTIESAFYIDLKAEAPAAWWGRRIGPNRLPDATATVNLWQLRKEYFAECLTEHLHEASG
jgi:hypothetical protein